MKIIDKFFNPESIAVIGASHTKGKIGYTILESLKKSFSGKIYPINPNVREILNLMTYSSVKDVEDKIDMAIVALPAEKVAEAVKECKNKKIEAVIIISSGFSEIGNNELEESVKKAGKNIRIIGPNCVGVFVPNRLDMLFMPKEKLKRPETGNISFISQSGAVGTALMDAAAYEGIGISKFASIGNRIDVNENELIEYFGSDIQTRCIAIYLESTANGIEFIKKAKKISKEKPIVCLKAGKTKKGQEAVASHTGSIAGSAEIYSAAFRQSGVIEAKNTEQLLDFSKALSTQPIMKGGKIAIVTDGGGFGVLAVDESEKIGLELPEFENKTITALKKILPDYAAPKNPLDLTGDSTSERYEKALDAVFKDKNINAVLIIALLQISSLDESIMEVIKNCKLYGKPFVVCAMGSTYTINQSRKLEEFGIPVYQTPERAVNALKALYDYGKWLGKEKRKN